MTAILTWLWKMALHIPALIVALLVTTVATWLLGLSVFLVAWIALDVNFVGAAVWGLTAGYIYFHVISVVGPPFDKQLQRLVPDAALSKEDLEARQAQRRRD